MRGRGDSDRWLRPHTFLDGVTRFVMNITNSKVVICDAAPHWRRIVDAQPSIQLYNWFRRGAGGVHNDHAI
jgi:hypothetical protein